MLGGRAGGGWRLSLVEKQTAHAGGGEHGYAVGAPGGWYGRLPWIRVSGQVRVAAAVGENTCDDGRSWRT
jgi:hypothetical protein